MPDCEKCLNEHRIIAMEKDAERNSQQHKEFYEAVKNGAVQQMKNETIYGQIFSMVSDIKSDLNEMKATPKRRIESTISSVITAIIGLVAGILFKGGF